MTTDTFQSIAIIALAIGEFAAGVLVLAAVWTTRKRERPGDDRSAR